MDTALHAERVPDYIRLVYQVHLRGKRGPTVKHKHAVFFTLSSEVKVLAGSSLLEAGNAHREAEVGLRLV